MTLNLNGLIPATILPMHADGRIDETALRSYTGWVAGQGPVALAINVDTGEGPHLAHDEKETPVAVRFEGAPGWLVPPEAVALTTFDHPEFPTLFTPRTR